MSIILLCIAYLVVVFYTMQLVCLCILILCCMLMQDGASVLVAVKTCKSDDDPTRTDQLLKEAGLFAFL